MKSDRHLMPLQRSSQFLRAVSLKRRLAEKQQSFVADVEIVDIPLG
jgi:uncharacterized Zn finger protein